MHWVVLVALAVLPVGEATVAAVVTEAMAHMASLRDTFTMGFPDGRGDMADGVARAGQVDTEVPAQRVVPAVPVGPGRVAASTSPAGRSSWWPIP